MRATANYGPQTAQGGGDMSTFTTGPRPLGMPRVYRDRTAAHLTHSVWSSEPDYRGLVRMYCGLWAATKLTRVTPDKVAETDCPECLRAVTAERERISTW